jgi:hypothetical protein
MPVERPDDAAPDEGLVWEPGFNEYLLGGVILLTLVLASLGVAGYLLPGDHLAVPSCTGRARGIDRHAGQREPRDHVGLPRRARRPQRR